MVGGASLSGCVWVLDSYVLVLELFVIVVSLFDGLSVGFCVFRVDCLSLNAFVIVL